MKSFKQFMNEETMPYANVRSGEMDVENSAVRDQINQLLAVSTSGKFLTPYIALERVAKTLANFHIFIPNQHFLEGDSGTMMWPVSQYGNKIGVTNQGEFVVSGGTEKDETHGPHVGGEGSYIASAPEENEYTIYFEYRQGDCGMFMVFCELVSKDELSEIIDDLEAELEDEGEEKDENEDGLVAEAKEEKDEPPFEPTEKKSTPYTSFKSKAKQLARDAMKKAKKKEKIDEVSKETAGRYIKKAADDAANAAHDMGQLRGSKDETEQEIFGREKAKYGRRMKGISMAVKKLTKEENLEEVSKKTLKSYIIKSVRNRQTGEEPIKKREKGLAKAADKLSKD